MLLNNNECKRFLSFGAGVQSTALLILIEQGKVAPVNCAIFADTGDEPEAVYEHLNKIKKIIKKTEIIISKSRYGTLTEFTKERKYIPAPIFGMDEKGKAVMGRRQCTSMFKVDVVHKTIRERLNKVRKKMEEDAVDVLLGISTDECFRVKKSRTRWTRNAYPLIYLKLSRTDCIKINKEFLGYNPMRSSCVYCPYKSKREFLEMKKNMPRDFKKAVAYDELIRDIKPNQKNYILGNRTPLSEIEDFNKDQPDLFDFHAGCDEGGCGL